MLFLALVFINPSFLTSDFLQPGGEDKGTEPMMIPINREGGLHLSLSPVNGTENCNAARYQIDGINGTMFYKDFSPSGVFRDTEQQLYPEIEDALETVVQGRLFGDREGSIRGITEFARVWQDIFCEFKEIPVAQMNTADVVLAVQWGQVEKYIERYVDANYLNEDEANHDKARLNGAIITAAVGAGVIDMYSNFHFTSQGHGSADYPMLFFTAFPMVHEMNFTEQFFMEYIMADVMEFSSMLVSDLYSEVMMEAMIQGIDLVSFEVTGNSATFSLFGADKLNKKKGKSGGSGGGSGGGGNSGGGSGGGGGGGGTTGNSIIDNMIDTIVDWLTFCIGKCGKDEKGIIHYPFETPLKINHEVSLDNLELDQDFWDAYADYQQFLIESEVLDEYLPGWDPGEVSGFGVVENYGNTPINP